MSSYPIGMLHLAPFLLLACAPQTGEATLAGFVRTPEGAPIVGATLVAEGSARTLPPGETVEPVTAVTGADGGYTLHLPADGLQPYSVQVGVDGKDEPPTRLTVHAGQHLTKHFAVRSTRVVALRCAGFADDSCRELAWGRCSLPDGAAETDASENALVEVDGERVAHSSIACPVGAEVVVRLAGQEVTVPASADVAWFDFTTVRGAVTGSVASDARTCLVSARRPFLVSYLGGGLTDSRYVTVPRGEAFRVDHLPPGYWVIRANCRRAETPEVTVTVGADVVDLGVLALE